MSLTLFIWWITSTVGHEGQAIDQTHPRLRPCGLSIERVETTVGKFSANPLVGVLEISTEDGALRLAISGDAAKDLRIDLDQFLAENQD